MLKKLLENLLLLSMASHVVLAAGPVDQQADRPFTFSLPSGEWSLAEIKENEEGTAKLTLYQRKALRDSSGAEIVPTIGFVEEDGSQFPDLIVYSVHCRTNNPLEVEQVFTWESGPLLEKRAIGYVGFYSDDSGKRHKIMVIHALKEKVGVQVVMDVIEELYPSVQGEFEYVAKSFRFTQ